MMPAAEPLLPSQSPSVVRTSEGDPQPLGGSDLPGCTQPSGSSDVSKWISIGELFLIWSGSVGRVPPGSHWGELSGPQHSGNQVGRRVPRTSQCSLCTLPSLPVFCSWTWRPSPEPLPVTLCWLLPECRGPSRGCVESRRGAGGSVSSHYLYFQRYLVLSSLNFGGLSGISHVPFWLCLGKDSAFLGLLNQLALTLLFSNV